MKKQHSVGFLPQPNRTRGLNVLGFTSFNPTYKNYSPY